MNLLFRRLDRCSVFLTAVIVFILDQASKFLVLAFFSDIVVFNEGAAFGLFQGFRWMFLGLGAVLLFFLWKAVDRYPYGETGLLLGGIAGNMLDRLVFGRVTDFITLGWWPSFNLADAASSCGVALLLLRFCLRRREFVQR